MDKEIFSPYLSLVPTYLTSITGKEYREYIAYHNRRIRKESIFLCGSKRKTLTLEERKINFMWSSERRNLVVKACQLWKKRILQRIEDYKDNFLNRRLVVKYLVNKCQYKLIKKEGKFRLKFVMMNGWKLKEESGYTNDVRIVNNETLMNR